MTADAERTSKCPGCGRRYAYCWRCHRTCARKRLYNDRDAARRALVEMRERKDAVRLTVYRCPMGEHYHLGNASGREGRRLERRAEKKRRKALRAAKPESQCLATVTWRRPDRPEYVEPCVLTEHEFPHVHKTARGGSFGDPKAENDCVVITFRSASPPDDHGGVRPA